MQKKTIIVGGVAGGASAAARLRRLDENMEIIMFERDGYISFANCGLPYYIGETIKDRKKLLVQTPEAMKKRFNIDVRIYSKVVKIDTEKKIATIQSKEKGTYEESFDYIVLSPGARAIRPNLPGIESEKIFTLRNIDDTDSIKAMVDNENITSAVVIGGGYVGVEMAENLLERGLKVSLAEAAPHILAPFDSDMSVIVEKKLTDKGIHLYLNDGVTSFRENGKHVEITLNSNKQLNAELVFLAIGVAPDTACVNGSNIKLGPKGHIVVNRRMETNVEGIYAVGDAVEVVDYITGLKTAIPLAGPANKQGRIAADNIAGLNSVYKGTQGTAIIKVFDITAAGTGANERTLKNTDMKYKTITIHPASHASYYPGAKTMTLKLIFSNEGKVLGAQAIGAKGVDKRIDVIATVIRLGGTVDDLAELELSYAPPFSSAKDPVNMAGFVAQNVLSGKSHLVTWDDVERMQDEEYTLLDIRTAEEYANGHREGALNIPVDSLRERYNELDKSKPVYLYCHVGLRGYIADRILSQNGFTVYNISGGYVSALQLNLAMVTSGKNPNHKHTIIDPDTQVVKTEEYSN